MLFVLSVILLLTGCNTSNNLVYLGADDIQQTTLNTTLGAEVVYSKNAGKVEMAVGAFDSTKGDFLGVQIKINNTGCTIICEGSPI